MKKEIISHQIFLINKKIILNSFQELISENHWNINNLKSIKNSEDKTIFDRLFTYYLNCINRNIKNNNNFHYNKTILKEHSIDYNFFKEDDKILFNSNFKDIEYLIKNVKLETSLVFKKIIFNEIN